jgi:sterol desaturase/sphingolipid hydroxylase (fatty acid hydroxylase superfamily)
MPTDMASNFSASQAIEGSYYDEHFSRDQLNAILRQLETNKYQLEQLKIIRTTQTLRIIFAIVLLCFLIFVAGLSIYSSFAYLQLRLSAQQPYIFDPFITAIVIVTFVFLILSIMSYGVVAAIMRLKLYRSQINRLISEQTAAIIEASNFLEA